MRGVRPSPRLLLGVVGCLAACAPVHRYPDGTGIEGQLEREVVALKLRVQELEASLSHGPSSSRQNGLVPELVQVFSGSGVLVSPYGNGARLTIPVQLVYADLGSLRLRSEGTMVFDLLATVIDKHTAYDVHVVGHWSDRPSPHRKSPTPLHLTMELARVFADGLASHDVPMSRVLVAGHGATAPLTSNDLPEGQDANERIDVVLALPPETFE